MSRLKRLVRKLPPKRSRLRARQLLNSALRRRISSAKRNEKAPAAEDALGHLPERERLMPIRQRSTFSHLWTRNTSSNLPGGKA